MRGDGRIYRPIRNGKPPSTCGILVPHYHPLGRACQNETPAPRVTVGVDDVDDFELPRMQGPFAQGWKCPYCGNSATQPACEEQLRAWDVENK